MNKLEFIQYCEAYLTKTKSWRAIRNAHISKDQINVDIARMDVQNLLQHYLSQQTHPKAALQDLIQFLLFQRPQGVRGVARAFLHEWVPSHRKHIWLQYGRFLPHKPYHSDSFTDLFADCQNYSPYGTSFEALQLMELMMQPFPGDPRAMALALACAAVAESQLPLGELGAWVALHHSLAPLFMQAHAVSAQWDAEWLKMIQHYFVGYVSLQVLIAIFDLLVLSSVETTEDMTLPSIGTWCQWTAQGLMQLTKDSKIPIHKRCWSVSLADFKQYMKSHYIDKLQQSLEHAHMNLSIDPMDDTVSLDERDFDQDPTVDVQIRIWEQKRQEKLRKRRRQLYYLFQRKVRLVIHCNRLIKAIRLRFINKKLAQKEKTAEKPEAFVVPKEEQRFSTNQTKKQMSVTKIGLQAHTAIQTLFGAPEYGTYPQDQTIKQVRKDAKLVKSLMDKVSKEMFNAIVDLETKPRKIQEKYYKRVQQLYLQSKDKNPTKMVFTQGSDFGTLASHLMEGIQVIFQGPVEHLGKRIDHSRDWGQSH